jgi:CheY-like chemotaxis protein
VRLPILVEKTKLHPPSAPKAIKPATASHRILVVDDNGDSAKSLARLLKITGNATHVAHDGLEAVDAAQQFRPDVVLLDIGLPRLNGFDACRRIREQPWGKNMVLVALTGWGQDEDRRKSKDAGFDHHMVKPVDYDVLMNLLASLPAPQGGY